MVSRAMQRVLDGPLIGLLEQQRSDRTRDRGLVGKMPTTSVRRSISPIRYLRKLIISSIIGDLSVRSVSALQPFRASSMTAAKPGVAQQLPGRCHVQQSAILVQQFPSREGEMYTLYGVPR